jgi:hypothetical protein
MCLTESKFRATLDLGWASQLVCFQRGSQNEERQNEPFVAALNQAGGLQPEASVAQEAATGECGNQKHESPDSQSGPSLKNLVPITVFHTLSE